MKDKVTIFHAVLFWGALVALAGAASVANIADSEALSSVRTKLNTIIGRVNALTINDGIVGLGAHGTALAISAGGSVTMTKTNHTVRGATDNVADDLDTITYASLASGDVVTISPDTGDTITIRDQGTSGGNIDLAGSTVLLNDPGEIATFKYDGTYWRLLAVSPSLLSVTEYETIAIACSDLSTELTNGTGNAYFRMPYAMTVTEVRASVITAGTGSGVIEIDINEDGTSIFTDATPELLEIDATEKTSTTAANAYDITDPALADDAEITIDIDAVPATTGGNGLIVYITGTRQ